MSRPLAVIPVYNESDILPGVLRHLEAQGCESYILDNWSTDEFTDWQFYNQTVERWPAERPKFYDWTGILKRIEEIALECGRRRWCMLHDADEIRRARWSSVTLAEGLQMVESSGYNAAKFAVRTYVPIDDSWVPGGDPEAHFRHYRPDHMDYTNAQTKAWLQGDERVDIHTYGGHSALFKGRRVFPEAFVLKHYPIRSQAHGERKMRERRYSLAERAKGWHVQYDRVKEQPAPRFVESPSGLVLDL